MNSRFLVETDVRLIEDHIRANISESLDKVSQIAENVPKLSLPNPKQYFYTPKNTAYQLPVVYIVPTDIDFRKQDKNANFIDASVTINVSVEVEEKDTDLLAVSAWRYQAALHAILDDVSLTNIGGEVKIVSKVIRASFSPIYTDAQKPDDADGVFRQEVLLELQIDHFERP